MIEVGALSTKPAVVHSDPEILGGTPVFVGTRVPIKNLYDYLEGGDSLDDFLEDFPSVTREQAVAALEFQQNIQKSGIGVVVVHVRRNRLQELRPLAPQILEALSRVKVGELIRVGG